MTYVSMVAHRSHGVYCNLLQFVLVIVLVMTVTGVITFDLTKKTVNSIAGAINRLALYTPVFRGSPDYYFINLGIGSDQQRVNVGFDSGSADFWIDKRHIHNIDVFKANGKRGSVSYGTGDTITGPFGESLVFVNGHEIANITWILASDNRLVFDGILGIGKIQNEAAQWDTKEFYPNFTQRLKDCGVIKTNGYSYYLVGEGGQVVFGGMDMAKINGQLVTLPQAKQHFYHRFDNGQLTLISYGCHTIELNCDVLFDTGSPLSELPEEVFCHLDIKLDRVQFPMGKEYGVYVDLNSPPEGFLRFNFSGVFIDIPLHDWATPQIDHFGRPTGRWWFGIQPLARENIIGNTIMRYGYFVVNNETETVAVAKVKNTLESNIVAI